ncbi:hypothetical protein HC62_00215 [Acetobacter tropicalis]|uniref:Uncharacterized protein n=2 Tax=Acetobacter tropicalis TaxID=104102 RepID=A0A251ZYR2_9PROT|nr:hypothetical protein HC62_00215 [Acetobacter tropicalis]
MARMIQLTYEPAFDPLHSIFRALRLRQSLATDIPIPRVLFRILDFYLLFPMSISTVRLLPKHRKLKKLAASTKGVTSYGPLPDNTMLFERMQPYQDAAMDTLVLRGFFSNEGLEAGWVIPTKIEPSASLNNRLVTINAAENNLMTALNILATDYPIDGSNGLKHRTGLLEYRYDAV